MRPAPKRLDQKAVRMAAEKARNRKSLRLQHWGQTIATVDRDAGQSSCQMRPNRLWVFMTTGVDDRSPFSAGSYLPRGCLFNCFPHGSKFQMGHLSFHRKWQLGEILFGRTKSSTDSAECSSYHSSSQWAEPSGWRFCTVTFLSAQSGDEVANRSRDQLGLIPREVRTQARHEKL